MQAIHGHPTRYRRANTAFACWPLLLWLPYGVYRRTHLRHHRDERLTDPLDDPESFYVTADAWHAMTPVERWLRLAMNTLAGRLTIGPFVVVLGFLRREARRLAGGDRRAMREWGGHLLTLVPVVAWITLVADLPIATYVACFVFPGTALVLMRSFIEHRAVPEVGHRTAIVEDRGLLSLIFLNNNLHALHHERPSLPWYAMRAHYEAASTELARRNGGYVFPSYLVVARTFGLRPKDHPVHPAERANKR